MNLVLGIFIKTQFFVCVSRERRMASEGRLANTKDERDLCEAARNGDAKRLRSLLQKGVDHNVYNV